jgi:hypothetical protein
MAGFSMIGPSQAWSVTRSMWRGPTSEVPSSLSCWDQMRVGRRRSMPSLLWSSQAVPSASTNGLGSMVPPWSRWQTNGPPDRSRNGPCGPATLTARDTQNRPVARSRTA